MHLISILTCLFDQDFESRLEKKKTLGRFAGFILLTGRAG